MLILEDFAAAIYNFDIAAAVVFENQLFVLDFRSRSVELDLVLNQKKSIEVAELN